MKSLATLSRGSLLTAAIAAFLSGCGATNPCVGHHGGLCTSPRLIYGVTRNRDQVAPTKQTLRDQKLAGKYLREPPSARDVLPSITPSLAAATSRPDRGAAQPLISTVSANTPTGPQPLLSQPHILRVWIAPWSRNGTLHFPGYVYTVVTPEKWIFAPAKGKTPLP